MAIAQVVQLSATNIAAAVMFGLMILAAVVLWVLVWRGHLG